MTRWAHRRCGGRAPAPSSRCSSDRRCWRGWSRSRTCTPCARPGSPSGRRGSLYVSMYVRRHVAVIVGTLLLLLAWNFRLDMYDLLAHGSGAEGSFTFVDHRVSMPGNLVLSLVALASALIVIWAGFVGQLRLAGAAVLGTVALSLITREVVPAAVRRSGTASERLERERPYVATRAGYTRRAFDVDAIVNADSSLRFA